MDNILLGLILLVGLAILTGGLMFWRRISEWQQALIVFTTPPDKDTPAPFALLVDSIAARAGRAMALEAKTTLMGRASGEAKREAIIQGALLQDQVSQANPMLAMAMQAFPSLAKQLVKNPALLETALRMLQSTGVRKERTPEGNHSAQSDTGLKIGV